ncbi:hypothetical protein ES703_95704 [subsurface metagenome]
MAVAEEESTGDMFCSAASADTSSATWDFWVATANIESQITWFQWNEPGDFDTGIESEPQLSEEEKKEQKEAERRAKKLLLELIGRTDYKKFCRSGYLDVEGRNRRIYRIIPRAQMKVFEGKDKLDVPLETLCIITPNHYLPEADEVVWKKLMIEADEEELLKIANHF